MPNENTKKINHRIRELDQIISDYESSNPSFQKIAKEYNTVEHLQQSLRLLLDEISKIKNQIEDEYRQIQKIQASIDDESLKASDSVICDIDNKLKFINDKSQSIDSLTEEICYLNKKITLIQSADYKNYLSAISEKEALIKSINLNKDDNSFTAIQRQTAKSGRTLLSKADLISNIYDNINSDWSHALCKKYNFDIIVVDKDTNIQFVNKANQSVIDVKKNSVSSNSKSENYSSVIQAMIEIYLKSVEGKNIFSHTVDSSDPVAKNKMEQMLASQLKEIGVTDNKINGKSIDQILNKKIEQPFAIENEQASSPSPKL